MTAVPPLTPRNERPAHPPPNRRLFTSPAISDYFSGDDCSNWTFSPEVPPVLKSAATFSNAPRAFSPDSFSRRTLRNSFHESQLSRSSPSSRLLLHRLNSVGHSILSTDLDDEHCERLGLVIDRIESTIAAPESQSREPAENEASGLFNDDETDASTTTAQTTGLGSIEAAELVRRVMKAAAELRQRFAETKHANDIATTKLEAAAHEIARLRRENRALRNSDSKSEIMYLRLQVRALQDRVEKYEEWGQKEVLDSVNQLRIGSLHQHEDRSVPSDLLVSAYDAKRAPDDDRSTDELRHCNERYRSGRKSLQKSGTACNGSVSFTDGLITPIHESDAYDEMFLHEIVSKETSTPREPLQSGELTVDEEVIAQTGHEAEKDPNLAQKFSEAEQQDSVLQASIVESNVTLEAVSPDSYIVDGDSMDHANDATEAGVIKNINVWEDKDQMSGKLDQDQEKAVVSAPQSSKSPWQTLWDDLADLAGIHDEYNDEVHDDLLAY